MDKKKKVFPKDFFTKIKPHNIQDNKAKEKDIPFEWSENVVSGKSKVKIISSK